MLTLDDIVNAPSDPVALNQHLQQRGLIPLPPPPAQGLPPATIAPMTPIVPHTNVAPMVPPSNMGPSESLRSENNSRGLATLQPPHAPSLAAPPTAVPEIAPMATPAPSTGDLGIKPMTPPDLTHAEKMALPSTSAGVPIGGSAFTENQLERLQEEKEHPWGSPDNHPGLLGKIGHGLARAGEIAADIVAPGLTQAIPGTPEQRGVQANALKRELAQRTAAEGQAAQRASQEKNVESEIAGRDVQTEEGKARLAKEQTEQSLEKDAQGNVTGWKGPDGKLHSLDEEGTPQAIKDIAEASKSKQGPQLEKTANGDIVQITTDKDGKATSQVVYHGDPKVETDLTSKTVNGQEHRILVNKNTGETIKDLGAFKTETSPAAAEKAEQTGEKWVTGEDENGKNVMVPRSQAKELGLKNIAEANADDVNKTKSARHVLPLLFNNDPKDPGVLQMIDDLDKKGKLGPLASRWNDFMARKFGADDPDYSALRARMDLATTKLMQAHVGSRGGSFMLEHFENIANAKKMGAADLRAGVDQELRYIHDISQLPSKKSAGGGGAAKPPAVGDIVGGYKFNGGEPSDKKNWTKQ
jgi:hypothetical protein